MATYEYDDYMQYDNLQWQCEKTQKKKMERFRFMFWLCSASLEV